MSAPAEDTLPVSAVRDFIAINFGIHYSQERLGELTHKLDSLSKRMGYDDAADCIDTLLAGRMSEEHLNLLIETITVGETYFFREPETIEAISSIILPDIAKTRERRLRIWIAGCATGEEAYTVAMFLHTRCPDLLDWNISILATDINNTFLAKARKGIYSSWSFRTIPTHYKSRYFHRRSDGRFELDETIRRMVRFVRINLVNGHFPSSSNSTADLDLILCRNVLMYFAPEMIRAIIARLARSLNDLGWLVVSQAEYSDYFIMDFDPVQAGNIFLYRKKGADKTEPFPAAPPPSVSLSRAAKLPRQRHKKSALISENNISTIVTTRKQPKEAAPLRQVTPTLEEILKQARLLADQGRLKDALSRCEEGIAANNLVAYGHYLYAAILQELGRLDDARMALRKVLYLEPDLVMAIYTLGTIEQKLGNRREALNHFDKAARMLSAYQDDQLLPEAEGLTVGHLKEFIDARRKALG